MDYRKIKKENYSIHLIKDKRFHTIFLKVVFTENVTYEKITYRNFIIDILSRATKNYDSKSKLLNRCQELYSMYPQVSLNRLGNLLSTRFILCMSNSNYIDQNYLKENILLLHEIILNPLLENSSFSNKYFEIIKNEQINEIKSQKENPRLYANIRLLELMEPDKNKYYTLTGFSDLEIIKNINTDTLYKSYLDMLKNSKIDIFVSGNITNEEKIVDIISNAFIFPNNKYKLASPFIKHSIRNKEIKYAKETIHNSQSKISIGIKAYNLNDYEIKYYLPILGIMLGGNTDSLLMQEVREKNSLAYYIGCYYNKLDSTIIINSGIDKINYEKTVSLIKEVLLNISLGKFKNSILKQSVHEYITDIESLYDSNNSLIEYVYGMDVFMGDTIENRVNIIKKITKADIINLAKKLEINAIFYLEGDLW